MCQDVNRIVGLQGSFASTESTLGLQRNIAQYVKDAWLDIQNMRKDWSFMVGTITSFSTTADQSTYTPTQVFGTATAAEDLGSYKRPKGIFYDYNPIDYIDYSDYPDIDNDTNSTTPSWYTINDLNNNLIINKPNDAYDLVIRYHRNAQDLSSGTDPDSNEPVLPSMYHNAIVYKAVEKMAIHIGRAGMFNEYSKEANKMVGSMLRKYIPKKSVNLGSYA